MKIQRINIAIASPGDVEKERQAVLHIFTRWNARNDHAMLHPVMWESASVPELGASAQELLNPRIVEKSDLLVAILWTKLGTPTRTASSGTVEEIREFIAKKGPKRVMLYFCTRSLPINLNLAEFAKLNEFKEQIRKEGLYHQYESVDQFERDLNAHLVIKVRELLAGELPLPGPPEPGAKKLPLHPDKRLHNLIDFGSTLPDISRGFSPRMEEFNAISGGNNDKYYRLGAHVYSSAAESLDQYLAWSAAGLAEPKRKVLEKVSTKLKILSANLPSPKDPFPDYWQAGTEIATELSAHVAHIVKHPN